MLRTLQLTLALACFVLLSAAPAVAQRDPEVTVSLASPLIRLGATARIDIRVEHTTDAQLLGPLPQVDGLIFSSPVGPIPNKAFVFSGGRMRSRVTIEWTLRVRPTAVGEYTIPPINLRVDGQPVSAPAESMQLRVIEDSQGAETGFLVITAPRRVYEGQPYTVVARFGFDQTQPIDHHGLYFPWWGTHRGVIEIKPTALNRGRHVIAVNDRKEVDCHQVTPQEYAGTVMQPFELRRTFLASRPGTLEFDASTYQFGKTLQRGIGFRSVPVRYYANAPAFEIDVLPVPEAGRPFEWSGAVGQIEASRRVNRRDVDEGDSIELTIVWTGDANLQFFDAPDLARLDAFSGFRVVGTTDETFPDERRVRYDLVPATAELQEIPAVPLWVFDTETERYTLLETRSVPIRVRPVEETLIGFAEKDEPEVFDLADLHGPTKTEPAPSSPPSSALLWTGLGMPLAWLLLRSAVRRRGDPDGPLARRRRGARRHLTRELRTASTASAQETALARFLAARTSEPDAAWIGRDPDDWLAARGPDPVDPKQRECLAELSELQRALDQRAWAAEDEPLEPARVLAVTDRLTKGGLV